MSKGDFFGGWYVKIVDFLEAMIHSWRALHSVMGCYAVVYLEFWWTIYSSPNCVTFPSYGQVQGTYVNYPEAVSIAGCVPLPSSLPFSSHPVSQSIRVSPLSSFPPSLLGGWKSLHYIGSALVCVRACARVCARPLSTQLKGKKRKPKKNRRK